MISTVAGAARWPEYVKALRKKKNMSQGMLARAVSRTTGAVGSWEYGRSAPRDETAELLIGLDPALAAEYGLSVGGGPVDSVVKPGPGNPKTEPKAPKEKPGQGALLVAEELRKLRGPLVEIAGQVRITDEFNLQLRVLSQDMIRLENRIDKMERVLKAFMGLE